MNVKTSVIELIGNTPLIRLNRLSDQTGCEILGKAEFLNPGQSVKDRPALGMVRDAEADGSLKPGGTIVEGTAGNTGIGLAMVGAALGYKVVIVMPRTQSKEKKDAVRNLGATLVEVDAVPYSNPNHYARYSGRLAEELNASEQNGAIWANQFDNVSNKKAHYETTGLEIWEQTDGKLDGFICAVGSGGTLAGIAQRLQEESKERVKIGLADPGGASLFEYFKNGELKSEGTSITEGIGQSRITANIADLKVDHPYRIHDAEALTEIYEMIQHEGLCLGGSSGINMVGAKKLAEDLGPGHTIVTILCDYGNRYQDKLFNPDFLRSKDLPTPPWMEG